MSQEPVYLTPEDVAKQLKFSRTKVWRLIRTKQLPAMKIGKEYRVTQEDVWEFMRKHRIQPPD